MMTRRFASDILRLVPAVLIVAACTRAVPQTGPMPEHEHDEPELMVRTSPEYIAAARADSIRLPYTQADVDFMSGMIHHHAQALVMSRMAPTHGASSSVQTLAARIINGQQDEIRLMQQWLIDRQKPVPMAHTSGPMHEGHEGMHPLMPGMLTPAQLQELDAARGTEFDRLFLKYMIQHHQGAVSMVKTLFGTYGAGQDETVFKFASDVNTDQTTEIRRMQQLLDSLPFSTPSHTNKP